MKLASKRSNKSCGSAAVDAEVLLRCACPRKPANALHNDWNAETPAHLLLENLL